MTVEWISETVTAVFDKETNTMKIQFNHFSLWRVLHQISFAVGDDDGDGGTGGGGDTGTGGGGGSTSSSSGGGDDGSSSGCLINLLAR